MGFFDSLFGGGKKAKPRTKQAVSSATAATETPAIAATPDAEPAATDAAIIAAVAAAVIRHAGAAAFLPRVRRQNELWKAAGRQKVMDSRLV